MDDTAAMSSAARKTLPHQMAWALPTLKKCPLANDSLRKPRLRREVLMLAVLERKCCQGVTTGSLFGSARDRHVLLASRPNSGDEIQKDKRDAIF